MSMNESMSSEHSKDDDKLCAKCIEKVSESAQSCPNCHQSIAHLTSELNIAAETKNSRNRRLEQIIAEVQLCSKINLASRQLVDQDMNIVAEQAIIEKQCTELDLGSNYITSKGAWIIGNELHKSPIISRLYLSDNQLADDGTHHLALSVENSTLFVLGLSKNGIKDEGAQYLSEMLKRNHRLTVLGLEYNDITDRGVEKLSNALKYNNNLQRLLLAGNKMMSDSSIDFFVDMLQYNRSLKKPDLRDCNLSDSAKAKLQEAAKTKRNFQLLD